jgi:hypothetical protein
MLASSLLTAPILSYGRWFWQYEAYGKKVMAALAFHACIAFQVFQDIYDIAVLCYDASVEFLRPNGMYAVSCWVERTKEQSYG